MTPPSIQLLGPLLVMRAGEPVPLPQSQKTRALLAYLAVRRRPQRRERLCEMFWDLTDDPRGALRWSLSKLRALDDEGVPRIRADRQSVTFEPAGAFVDAREVRSATAGGLDGLSPERLRELAGLFRGDFLDGLALPELGEYQAWRVAERERFRRLHVQILRTLVARLGDQEEALDPARELVRLTPEDAASRATLIRVLTAADRREEAEEHYHLGRKLIARSSGRSGELDQAWREAAARLKARSAGEAGVARQDVRFCKAPDGVRIAYATLGHGPPLVKTANWMSHLEYDWKSPLWRHVARDLSRDFQLVRYDQRGNGLSDWNVDDFSLRAFTGDLEAVVDALGVRRFPLLGISQGCRVALAFAAENPERVSHLILYGGSPRGWKHRGQSARETREGLQALIRHGWGRDEPVFRQVFTTLFMPDATPEQTAWFNELQRVSTSPENAARITEASGAMDVTDLLGTIRAPTLVMHATHDAMVPFEEAHLLAAGIPGARFVALEGRNHLLLEDEPAFARFLSEVRDFLSPPVTRRP